MDKIKVVHSGNQIIVKRAVLLVMVLALAAFGAYRLVADIFGGKSSPDVQKEAKKEAQKPYTTAFQNLFYAAKSGMAKDIEKLAAGGANVNEQDENGWTSLMWAARNSNSVAVIETLLKAGANVNLTDDKGRSALELAGFNKSFTDALKRAGAR